MFRPYSSLHSIHSSIRDSQTSITNLSLVKLTSNHQIRITQNKRYKNHAADDKRKAQQSINAYMATEKAFKIKAKFLSHSVSQGKLIPYQESNLHLYRQKKRY